MIISRIRVRKNQAIIRALRRFVQFGCFRGSALKDPQGLLEGKGQYARHINVHKPSEIDDRAFAALLREASGRKS